MEVRVAGSPAEVEAALDLRHQVFCAEQGVSPAADQDGRDGEALHIVAVEDGRVVGTCRLVFDGRVAKLGRMVVDAELRGRGIGALVLEEAERQSREAGADRIFLHAQLPARPLYARAGFSDRGRRFVEEGIPHVGMEKPLA